MQKALDNKICKRTSKWNEKIFKLYYKTIPLS